MRQGAPGKIFPGAAYLPGLDYLLGSQWDNHKPLSFQVEDEQSFFGFTTMLG